MATPDQTRRSKRGATHDDTEDELSIKIPRIDELLDDDEKRSRASSVSPAVGGVTLRRESRAGQDKPAELFRKDLISAMKLADTEQLQPDNYLTISDAWKQEWETGVQVPVNPSATIQRNVVIRQIPGYKSLHGSYGFKIPKKYLHATQDNTYKQGIHELHDTQKLADQMCRYDLDDIDVMWLTKCNEERQAMGLEPILEWVMERLFEELENQCYSNMQKTIKTVEGLGIEYDENVVCDVCRNPEGEDNNEIVFCDGCDICVHQACYGIKTIPEGSWLCRTCALGIQPKCILCPKTGGAMKSTKSGTKWAHVSCALWIPEVSIGCPEKMEPITKISQIPSSRWSLICNICRERSGSCIQCSVKTCKTAFHVTCAFNNNLSMKTILDEDHDDIQLRAHCTKHSGKRKEGDTTPRKEPGTPKRDLILRRDLSTPSKKESEMTEEEKTELRSHRLGKLAEEFYCCVEVPEVAEACKMDEELVDFVYSYWVLKRKSNFNKPLLTPKTEEADLLLRQREDSLVARMKMFIHLRQDLERVRNLCYMVSKREKVRRQLYNLKEEVFHQQALMLDKLSGSQAQTREYCAIVGAHRQPETIYDQYDALLRTAKIDEKMSRLEDDTCSDMDDSEPTAKLPAKQKRTAAFRDSKRRLAFHQTPKSKNIAEDSQHATPGKGDSVVDTRTSGRLRGSPEIKDVSECDRVSLPRQTKLTENYKQNGAGPGENESEGKKTSSLKNESGKDGPNSKLQAKRHTAEELSPGKRSKPSPSPVSPSTQKEKSFSSPSKKQAADEKASPSNNLSSPSKKQAADEKTSPSNNLSFPSKKQAADEKYSPSNEKTNSSNSFTTPSKKQPADEKTSPSNSFSTPSPSKTPPCDPSQWLRRSTRTHETLPEEVEEFIRQSESSEGQDFYHSPVEDSKTSKQKSSPCKSSCGETPSKKSSVHSEVVKDTKSQEQNKSRKCSEKLPVETSRTNVKSISPKETRQTNHRKEQIATSPSKSSSKLGKNGQSLPQVEVSVDENSGKISLHVRKNSESVASETSVEQKHSHKTSTSDGESVSLHCHTLDRAKTEHSPSRDKQRFRTPRRSSIRIQSLGINGLVSPSQLVVKQEIKDRVHSSLGRLRSRHLNQNQMENGVVDSSPRKMDKLLSPRKNSLSGLEDDKELLDVARGLTKENNPGNGPLHNKFRPISLDLSSPEKTKKIKLLSSPKSERNSPHSRASIASVSTSGRSTPEMRRSLRQRLQTPDEMGVKLDGVDRERHVASSNDSVTEKSPVGTRSNRTPIGGGVPEHRVKSRSSSRPKSNASSVLEISDSEDSVNVPFVSDSEYAPSEGSFSSDNSRKLRSRQSSSKVTPVDEASRDSTTSSVRSSSRHSRSWSKVVGTLQS